MRWVSEVIIISLLLIYALGLWFGRRDDIKQWNNGICIDTNKPNKPFDTNSQGGRGYCSEDGDKAYYTWISYPGVDSINT